MVGSRKKIDTLRGKTGLAKSSAFQGVRARGRVVQAAYGGGLGTVAAEKSPAAQSLRGSEFGKTM